MLRSQIQCTRRARCNLATVLLGWVTLFLIGCEHSSKLETEYGKVNSKSINGVGVLADLFAQRGHRVDRDRRITQKLELYDTIVWAPDRRACPSLEAELELEAWLYSGWRGRTLIYVGRDFQNDERYLTSFQTAAPLDEQKEILRLVAESKIAAIPDDTYPWNWTEDRDECYWFSRKEGRTRKAKKYGGPWSELINVDQAELELGDYLEPTDDQTEMEIRLTVNDHPFVYAIGDTARDNVDGKVVVVANGSFLLNYSAINAEHRKLCSLLINECPRRGRVLFLESGPADILVSSSDEQHNAWGWIAEPPLRYIVPHFLIWGILFCFVFYPIFGRPQKLKRRNLSTFRAHINAVGKLLARTRSPKQAIEKIEHFQNLKHPDRSHRRNS